MIVVPIFSPFLDDETKSRVDLHVRKKEHIKQLIEEKVGLGNQLMVCGDFNSIYTELKYWMLDFTLTDMLSTKYWL